MEWWTEGDYWHWSTWNGEQKGIFDTVPHGMVNRRGFLTLVHMEWWTEGEYWHWSTWNGVQKGIIDTGPHGMVNKRGLLTLVHMEWWTEGDYWHWFTWHCEQKGIIDTGSHGMVNRRGLLTLVHMGWWTEGDYWHWPNIRMVNRSELLTLVHIWWLVTKSALSLNFHHVSAALNFVLSLAGEPDRLSNLKAVTKRDAILMCTVRPCQVKDRTGKMRSNPRLESLKSSSIARHPTDWEIHFFCSNINFVNL